MIRMLQAVVGSMIAFYVGLAPISAADEPLTPMESTIDIAIRDFILNNPKVIRDALANAELVEQLDRTKQVLRKESDAIYRSNSPTLGPPDSKVSIVLFFDYNCSHCRNSYLPLKQLLTSNPDVQIIFKDIANYGKDSASISKLVIASRKQFKYLALHEALMQRQGTITEAIAIEVARKIGIDVEIAKRDASLPETARSLASTRDLASRLNVEGTPLFIIGHNGIAGAPDDLIDQLTKHVAEVRKSGCSVC